MMQDQKTKARIQKPRWLRRRLPTGYEYENIRKLLNKGKLRTVCQEANCPNIWECFSQGTATFLIMGSRCTRNCRFCAVAHGPSDPPDPDEPMRVARAAQDMGLGYVVVTSVTRDDLSDGGAVFFAETIKEIHKRIPDALAEVLIPDFQGNADALRTVLAARPDVLNHNLETVPRLYSLVRPEAVYDRSLELLKRSRIYDPGIPTKSGLMLGLGETPREIRNTLKDLLDTGCRILTLGQYLQPSEDHLPVECFIPPKVFDNWRETALKMGFSKVASGPFVRSSYHAKDLYQAVEF
ncbi:lipoyl synthase [Desulfonema magnum]|uniref:Lipoyl synthase n=1 Tax=Desulfonema magnum TaxID=45655 RepID=A0A975BN58_9BACT|nr:lipoyl synthase [Desulfonema magnum]QTA88774.1 Lipoyl synthase (lipoate synthase) [Desulfonema magnum]